MIACSSVGSAPSSAAASGFRIRNSTAPIAQALQGVGIQGFARSEGFAHGFESAATFPDHLVRVQYQGQHQAIKDFLLFAAP